MIFKMSEIYEINSNSKKCDHSTENFVLEFTKRRLDQLPKFLDLLEESVVV